jgi:uncharacterized protein
MRRETVKAVVRWQHILADGNSLEITFHGGEPLVPGAKFYRMALPILREGLAPRRVRFAMQSNLWLLTDELCEVFRAYGVSIGTSLDGPELITDAQRGQGYFRRTMAGIERARSNGISADCICTFSAQSAPYAEQIFDFFAHEGLNFTLHAALPSLRYPTANAWTLSPKAHGELLVKMLDRYLDNLGKVRINTLDTLCRSVSTGRGGICTFDDCLGGYLAVGPGGEIYPCQRFGGMSEYQLGNVHDSPSLETLSESFVWRTFQKRQEHIGKECGDCPHLGFCRGGCPYNALAANGEGFNQTLRDPHCSSYRRIFDYIVDRAMEEVFSEDNMDAVVSQADPEAGLLRRGKLLSIMRDGPHPYQVAQHARRILAAVALAATGSPLEAARRFQQLGLVTNASRTEAGMVALHRHLTTPATGLNNLYLHVTFACPLRCTHCYAQAGSGRSGSFSVADVVCACHQAAELGFRHAVITGGEPLVHPQRDGLLNALAELREGVKPLLTVLRTSLALPMDNALLQRISHSTDEVVVSVDGDRETHDTRRGAGTYDLTVGNLRALIEMGYDTGLSLATVLPLQLANGPPGDAVRALAQELGIRRTRFRPVLPLGRAVDSELDIVPETLWRHVDPRQVVAYGFSPVASCGMGKNLYVEPDGTAYPCYAWHGEDWLLGHINSDIGLSGVIGSPAFQGLSQHTVNTNRQCGICPLRYLCGGACRAWNRQPEQEQYDLDAPPADCSLLHKRARSLLVSALDHLGIAAEGWLAAGLPLPALPPKTKWGDTDQT